MSPGMASRLSEAMPTYNPPPPEPETPPEETTELGQPKNKIIRLPKMVVEGERPPVFSEREVHTDKGLAELAMRRYLTEVDRGLNKFTIPLFGTSNEARALAQFREDERLRNMAATDRQISMIQSTDPEEARRLKEIATDTFIRTPYLPEPTSMNRDGSP